ncbi:MAG: ATP-binding protein, partial [Patescibacteria group bacterium]
PPGLGSRLLKPFEENILFEHFARHENGIRLLATGGFSQDDIGTKCYHSKTGAVELLLNHMIDTPEEYILTDMTAGADSFASGLFTKFDITCVVVEPTLKSIAVYKQYKQYASEFNIPIVVIANKIITTNDIQFLTENIDSAILATLPDSHYVRSLEKGNKKTFDELEEETVSALEILYRYTATVAQNREAMHNHALLFHIKNAESWGNTATGVDLTKQIDPHFIFPAA